MMTNLMKMVMCLLLLKVVSTSLAKKELNKRENQVHVSMCSCKICQCLVQSVGSRLHKATL